MGPSPRKTSFASTSPPMLWGREITSNFLLMGLVTSSDAGPLLQPGIVKVS